MKGFIYPEYLEEMDIDTFMNYVELAVIYKHNYIFKDIEDMINTLINKCHVNEEFARKEINNIIHSCYNKKQEKNMIFLLKENIVKIMKK